ncbi:Lrp/AsnC family transcriptional regulator [Niveibacterium sp. 24ML]|uniref:Lrp/AsnC family transcriptional regulator n=1 Tax=Niveibacterium sp. 24ML TaxID=2985512 RepID=UPI00227172B2|nr:Lrp/AsnC family transcriptional regulator [Niveibacterium sp. 24ML]MCX9156445.1 Lrp/AsnC family transcriptional regulator [Niveibacterium sp. 24ML]
MNTPVKLDRTDRRILEVLQQNGRIPNVELAKNVALSPSPCLRRLQRLEEDGVINHYTAILNPAKLGLTLLAFVSVSLDKRAGQGTDDFKGVVQQWPEVTECYAMTGEMDYLLRVLVTDLQHFSRFVMEKLLRHPGVLDVKSSFALEEVKRTTVLPVDELIE